MRKRSVLRLGLMLCIAGGMVSCTPLERGREARAIDVAQARHEAAHKTRRIIMNNDGNDCLAEFLAGPPTPENFLAIRTTPLVGSQVDAIFYCSGVFNIYTNHSSVTELQDHLYGERRTFAKDLYANCGKDPLTLMIEFCHAHRIEIFWSMRMNDTHDSSPQWAGLMSQWKKDHPELLMGKRGQRFAAGNGRWSSVNYGEPVVREQVYRILEDVITRYDIDGVELDFFRHPVYFKSQMMGGHASQEECDEMTALVARVRALCEQVGRERKRPMLIAARVPDSVSYSLAIGLDLERWLRDDLVDILTGSCYFHLEPWENWAALGRRWNVPVYACLSGSRLVSSSSPEAPADLPQWRGEALNAWEAGVSGIYTFNLFDPRSPLFRELGDPKLLRTLPHTYKFDPGSTAAMRQWLKGGEKYLVPE